MLEEFDDLQRSLHPSVVQYGCALMLATIECEAVAGGALIGVPSVAKEINRKLGSAGTEAFDPLPFWRTAIPPASGGAVRGLRHLKKTHDTCDRRAVHTMVWWQYGGEVYLTAIQRGISYARVITDRACKDEKTFS